MGMKREAVQGETAGQGKRYQDFSTINRENQLLFSKSYTQRCSGSLLVLALMGDQFI